LTSGFAVVIFRRRFAGVDGEVRDVDAKGLHQNLAPEVEERPQDLLQDRRQPGGHRRVGQVEILENVFMPTELTANQNKLGCWACLIFMDKVRSY